MKDFLQQLKEMLNSTKDLISTQIEKQGENIAENKAIIKKAYHSIQASANGLCEMSTILEDFSNGVEDMVVVVEDELQGANTFLNGMVDLVDDDFITEDEDEDFDDEDDYDEEDEDFEEEEEEDNE